MPYTPPAGSAVNFIFTNSYSPPGGGSVIFNFGGSVPPPPPGSQLPTGLRHALLFEDDWFFTRPSRFSPIPAGAAQPISFRHSGLARFRLEDEESWLAPRRQEIRFVPPARRRRRALFTVC